MNRNSILSLESRTESTSVLPINIDMYLLVWARKDEFKINVYTCHEPMGDPVPHCRSRAPYHVREVKNMTGECGCKDRIHAKCKVSWGTPFAHALQNPQYCCPLSVLSIGGLDINYLAVLILILQRAHSPFCINVPSLFTLVFVPSASFQRLGIFDTIDIVPKLWLGARA